MLNLLWQKAKFDERYQFLRKGYFTLDKDSSEDRIVFNRTVTLKRFLEAFIIKQNNLRVTLCSPCLRGNSTVLTSSV